MTFPFSARALSLAACAGAALALPLVLSCAPAAAAGEAALGRRIAKANCARCHAIGKTGESANPKAPPFRVVAVKYRGEDLEEAFAEGIMVGHRAPEMPEFEFRPRQIEALIAYLGRLRGK